MAIGLGTTKNTSARGAALFARGGGLPIPTDSLLFRWCRGLSITEIPRSYQITMGLSVVGALLKRNVWVDQKFWKVWPNISVLLVGPSGIGKDTVCDRAESVLEKVGGVPVVLGRTIEAVYEQMLDLGDPACCVTPATEISSFIGAKDYQKGMVQELTDILSTKEYKDVSLKGGGKKRIVRPTLTVWGGSTMEWLHKAMPDGALEGGMFPRFLVVCEEYGGRKVPLVGWSVDPQEVMEALLEWELFLEGLEDVVRDFTKPTEMVLLDEARRVYTNWYINREKYFSKAVAPYANRSRDSVLRVAMVMAVTRGKRWIEGVDVEFGIRLMGYIADRIDRAVQPPTVEAQAADEVLRMLPATHGEIVRTLGRKYTKRILGEAVGLLMEGERAKMVNKKLVRLEQQ